MAFNMNGSPLNKLNLFRKGRGKEYRQTKRAIKKAVTETGGFVATEVEGGGARPDARAPRPVLHPGPREGRAGSLSRQAHARSEAGREKA